MKRPPSLLLCFFFPFLLLLGGLSFGGMFAYREIPPLLEETARGMVPEGFQVTAVEPGKYTVWLQVWGQIGERFHHGEETLPPGAKIYLFDESSGREVKVANWVSATRNVGHEKAVSLGTFQTVRPDQTILVKGTGFRQPVLVSVSPTNTGAVLRVVLTLLGIIAITLTASIIFFISLLHRRQRILEDHSRL